MPISGGDCYTSTFGFGISFSPLLGCSCERAPRSIFGASEGTLRAGNQGQARRHGGDKIVELVRTVLGVAGDHSGSSKWRDKDMQQHQRKRAPLGFFVLLRLDGAPRHRNIQGRNFSCMTTRAHIATPRAVAAAAGGRGAGGETGREAEGGGPGPWKCWDMLTCRTSWLACVTSHLCLPYPHPQTANRPCHQAQAMGRCRRRDARRATQPGE